MKNCSLGSVEKKLRVSNNFRRIDISIYKEVKVVNKYSCCISCLPDLTTDFETTDLELITNLLPNQFHELRIYLVQLWLFTYFDNRWRCSRFMAKAGRFGLLSSNELKFGNHLLMEYVRKYLFFNIMSFYINFEWKLCHIL